MNDLDKQTEMIVSYLVWQHTYNIAINKPMSKDIFSQQQISIFFHGL
jgi:hypothetical protein